MRDDCHLRLPRTELAATKRDLTDEARLDRQTIRFEETDNGDDTVRLCWFVTAADAPDPGAGSVRGMLVGAGTGAAIGATLAGQAGAAAVAIAGAVVGAVAGAPSDRSTGDPGRADIAAAIADAAPQFDVSPETLAAIAFVESSFRIDADNPHSSAFGLFQFLDATWKGVVRDHGAPFGVAVGDRRDLRAQCLMGAAFLADNSKVLRRSLGRPPAPAECYAAHFFGAGTAARLLSGGGDVAADVALGNNAQQVIDANRSIFVVQGRVRTVREVLGLFETKIGRGMTEAGKLLGTVPALAAPTPTP